MCLLLVGAGCAPAKPSAPPAPPAVKAPEPLQKTAVQPPSDIRVTAIKATTNPTGDITEKGCEGPRVDLVLTVQNFGIDFPTDAGLDAWKKILEERQEDGAKSFDESAVLTVAAKVDFGEIVQQAHVELLPKDLPGGRLKNGQTIDVPARVLVPCCDPVGEFTVSANIMQSSLYFLPTGDKGIKEPYEDSFVLALPDITPGKGQLIPKEGQAVVIAGVENIGNAPTVGPVEVSVSLFSKKPGEGGTAWTMRIEEPFSGSATAGPNEIKDLPVDPDYDHIRVNVLMLCPKEPHNGVHDANPGNNSAERKATGGSEAMDFDDEE